MKKIIALFLAVFSLFGLAACKEDTNAKSEGSLTHAEYIAAAKDTQVTIEAYVQAKQSWWENKATIYLQDGTGGYFVYELTCTKEQYDTDLAVGNKIKVTGVKGEWSGEIEILGQQSGKEATYEVLEGNYVAEALDVTQELGKDTLVNYQNMKVSFKDLKVVAQEDGTSAFYYKWNNSGAEGDDLYVTFVDANNNKLACCVESYLTDKNSDVYKAVKELKVGDTVDLEGFLYWYEGAQPHLTSVVVK